MNKSGILLAKPKGDKHLLTNSYLVHDCLRILKS